MIQINLLTRYKQTQDTENKLIIIKEERRFRSLGLVDINHDI